MAPPPAAAWKVRALAGLRLVALALSGALLVHVALVNPALSPWLPVALPAGLAVAAALRWGPVAGAAVSAGVLGLLWHQQALAPATLHAALVALAPLLTRSTLVRMSFDARLDRVSDVVALSWVLPALGALPLTVLITALTAGLVTLSPAATAPLLSWPTLLGGWMTLSLGLVGMAVCLLSMHRWALFPTERNPRWTNTLGAATAAAALAALFAVSSGTQPTEAALALFLAPVVLGLLALRGQLAMASVALLVMGLLGAAQLGAGALLWRITGNPSALAIWTACLLGGLLICHAASVHWRDRALRWEWALDGTRLGVADWHLLRDRSFASDAWRQLCGLGPGPWQPAHWLEQVHPDDRQSLGDAMAAVGAGKDGRRQLELRMRHGTGWRWLEATLLVIERHRSGRPLRLLATLADVHQRHQAQEQQRMSVSLFQHLHEGLLITDADLRVLDVNPAYSQITGVPREQLLGTVPSLLQPDPADPVARQQRAAMWAGLRDQDNWRGELHERRRNGEFCSLQATISTVRGPAHDLRYHVLVISDITEQQQQRDRLERQAHTDELTRLPNRSRLSRLLDDAMQAADRDGCLLVVCYLDLDRFKPVNDLYGHAAGDRLLVLLAERLRSALRGREAWEDGAARLGGDEFVLLMRAGTLSEARLAVERVLRVVSRPYHIAPDEPPAQITASLGATVYPIDRSDADTLLRHADQAMYGAKQSGRNGYLFFDPEHRRRAEERVTAIGRVQEALDLQEFVLHYQPKVDMRNPRVLGFEALLRWEHPQQGLIAPLNFLPMIEDTGLSARIGDWVIGQALDHLAQWRRAGLDFSVSVNVSARHLQEIDFAQRLSELLARHPEPLASLLEIEILETTAHEDVDATSALMARCQGIGVRFALDDFGTGYSTLTYLKRLPVDVLKIDRSFVHTMLNNAQDRAIVEGVIGLARTFGCTVVAEGVESPAQARALMDLGCDIGQGTGIAAPMPAEEVAHWVRDYRGLFTLTPAQGVSAGSEVASGVAGRGE